MIRLIDRPWGDLQWVLGPHSSLEWDVMGCLSSEEGCTGIVDSMSASTVRGNMFFDIQDIDKRTSPESSSKREQHRSELRTRLPLPKLELPVFDLLERISGLADTVNRYLEKSTGNVILDVSCMPKRFFFPCLKMLCSNDGVKNLVVTYTEAARYGLGDLSGNAMEWSHIPMFMASDFPEKKPAVAIVGVGFMSMGLPRLLVGRYRDAQIELLFPFPPGPPSYQRNWDFVRRIMEHYPALDKVTRVYGLSVSDSFSAMERLTQNGTVPALLAPYGPKPVSVAMALLALKYGYPVYYTQPTYYSPEYSRGKRKTYGYQIKRGGTMLY